MKPSQSMTPPCQPVSSSPTREELATFMPLVHQEVARMLRRVPRCVQRGDLEAAGAIGLLDALRKSANRGEGFPGYARMRIRGAMVDELRSEDWLSRRARARTTQATADGAVGGTFLVALDDLPHAAQELPDEGAPNALEMVLRRSSWMELRQAVGRLPEREASIVEWHYLDDVPFNVIASRLRVTAARVSQLHARALRGLRDSYAGSVAERAA